MTKKLTKIERAVITDSITRLIFHIPKFLSDKATENAYMDFRNDLYILMETMHRENRDYYNKSFATELGLAILQEMKYVSDTEFND